MQTPPGSKKEAQIPSNFLGHKLDKGQTTIDTCKDFYVHRNKPPDNREAQTAAKVPINSTNDQFNNEHNFLQNDNTTREEEEEDSVVQSSIDLLMEETTAGDDNEENPPMSQITTASEAIPLGPGFGYGQEEADDIFLECDNAHSTSKRDSAIEGEFFSTPNKKKRTGSPSNDEHATTHH